VSPSTILIAGDAVNVMLTVAGDLHADLLVIGTRQRLLPGGRAAKQRRWLHARSPCPVLEVTADPPTPPRPVVDPILVT
jgi:nucleotide-binding universal stress UspA family protein